MKRERWREEREKFKTDDDDDWEGREGRVSWTTKQLVLRHERGCEVNFYG